MVDREFAQKEPLKKAVEILTGYGAKKIGVFGSYARGEAGADSDLDLLVEFGEKISLLAMVRIEREISEAVGTAVDLLTYKSISPYLVDQVLKEERVIYE